MKGGYDMRKYYKIIAFGIVELFSYFLFRVKNLELFFMLWAFLSLFVLAYIFIGDSKEFIRAGNTNSNRNGSQEHTQNYFAQKMGESISTEKQIPKAKKKDTTTIIILIAYLVVNILGLILTI